jgi:hypothetical protein
MIARAYETTCGVGMGDAGRGMVNLFGTFSRNSMKYGGLGVDRIQKF